MIAYCSLEELEPPTRQQKVVEEPVAKEAKVVGREETELNYVIMAFIVGVIILAVSDSIRA
jgi:Trk K+ transport system NAD-binding subunit